MYIADTIKTFVPTIFVSVGSRISSNIDKLHIHITSVTESFTQGICGSREYSSCRWNKVSESHIKALSLCHCDIFLWSTPCNWYASLELSPHFGWCVIYCKWERFACSKWLRDPHISCSAYVTVFPMGPW